MKRLVDFTTQNMQQRRLSRSRQRSLSFDIQRHSKVSHWLEFRSRGCFRAGSSFSGFSGFSSRREARQTFSYVLMIRLTTPRPPEKLSAETRPSRQRKLQGCSRRAKPRLAGKKSWDEKGKKQQSEDQMSKAALASRRSDTMPSATLLMPHFWPHREKADSERRDAGAARRS